MPMSRFHLRETTRACLALVSLSLLVAPGLAQVAAEEELADEVEGLADTRVATRLKVIRQLPSRRLGVTDTVIPEVRLPEVDIEALLREDAEAASGPFPMRQRIGIGRELSFDAASGNWWDMAERGRLFIADIAASGAAGVRVHLTGIDLPAGAELVLYSPAGASDPRVGSSQPSFLDPSGERDLWTGTFFGERVRIEYYEPAELTTGVLPFRVEELQHLYHDPLAREFTGLEKAAGPCHNDVSCYPDWSSVAAGTARIVFVKDSSSYVCTGQLLNNKTSDLAPLFLTANHCVSSQGVAQTVEFFWFYQTATCGGTPPSPNSVPRSRGASLVGSAPSSDGSLLMAEGSLPEGLWWLGWNAGKIADRTASTGVHHPAGDFKRISFGTKVNAGECPAVGIDLGIGNRHLKIGWTDGTIEGGSSGSGIYTNALQLFGTASASPTSECAAIACYGEFASHYKVATLKKVLLKGGTDDNLEQNDSCSKGKLIKKPGFFGGRIVKLTDEDYYKTSVPPGRTVSVSLSFANANGDIDLAAYDACTAAPLLTRDGTGNGEAFSLTNLGSKAATLYWRVWVADDVRNGYDMTVGLQ